jgi:SOS-response transcriptional repressor LexA
MNISHLPVAVGGLTPMQRDCMLIIQEMIAFSDQAPSYEEIRAEMDTPSRSHSHRLVHGLADRGFITFVPERPRSIELVRRIAVPLDLAAEYTAAELELLGVAGGPANTVEIVAP